jgi:predicted transcriptional regulator
MPRREWSRPFPEIRSEILAALSDRAPHSSDELVRSTGLPFEDVISALRMLRHSGDLDFDPEWEREGVMRSAHNIRLRDAEQP